MMRILVENFQSIEKAEIELQSGSITAVVGDSNSGKSALVRAVRSLIVNPRSTNFIREGKKYTRVALEFEDTVVGWQKDSSGSVVYVIDDERISKFGRSIPEQVVSSLRLSPISFGVGESLLNVRSQFDPMFFVGDTGPARYAVLAELAGLSYLSDAVRKLKTELRGIGPKVELLNSEIFSLEEFIFSEEVELAAIKDLYSKAVDLNKYIFQLTEKLDTLLSLKESFLSLVAVKRSLLLDLDFLSSIESFVLQRLAVFVDLFSTYESVYSKYIVLFRLRQRFNALVSEREILSDKLVLLSVVDVDLLERFSGFVLRRSKLIRTLTDLTSLRFRLFSLLDERRCLLGLDFSNVDLVEVYFSEFVAFVERLKYLVILKNLYDERASLVVRYSELDVAVVELESAISNLLSLFDICPLCGQPIGECND